MTNLKPVSPGELLLEEFLQPAGISLARLATQIGLPVEDLDEIVAGTRAITADVDARLCRFLQLSDGYWLRAQAKYDAELNERS